MRFYLDEMLTRRVLPGLLERGHDAVMAVDSGMTGADDFAHLAFASS